MWKDIKGYEGIYQISDTGQVRSLSRYVKCRNGVREVKSKILTPVNVGGGYKQVSLCQHSKCKRALLHRLIAEAFIPNPDNLPCINHKDGNPSNNAIDNLEWCTYGYNSNYYICKERQRLHMLERYQNDTKFLDDCKKRLDKWHNRCKKKVCQIDLNNNLVKIWDSTTATAKDGFIPNDVGQCANHKRNTHHGFKWVWYEDYNDIKG